MLRKVIMLLLLLSRLLPLYAQDRSVTDSAVSADTLNEVVVTGVSRATPLRENPVAITRISAKSIDRSVETNIIDVLVQHTPGLNAVKTGPNISKPFIRGLGYNRVLTLYDGIRQEGQQWGDEHGIEVDAYNIDHAEVIKGPASLLYGSDALAGVVSLFPYLPSEKDGQLHGRFLSEYQDNNGLFGNGLRLSYSNSHWSYAIRGSFRQARNYTDRIDGRVYNTGFRENNLSWTTGYTASKGYTYFNATLYDDLQGIPDGSRDSLTRKFTRQVFEGSADDLKNRPIVPDDVLNSYVLSPLHQHIRHYRLYTNNHYQAGNSVIDATLGFQQNIRREYSHPTAPAQAGLFVRLNTINYGLLWQMPERRHINIALGANGMYQNNQSRNATDFPIPDYHLFDKGIFLYGKWKGGPVTLSGGIRYDARSVKGGDFYTAIDPGTGFTRQVSLPDTAGATLQFPALDKNFSGTSLSFGLTYQLTGKISLKVNLARGYRSPNLTELSSNGLDPGAHIIYLGNRDFSPEFSFQQDLGINAYFDDLTFSSSLFINNIRHYIYLRQQTGVNGNPLTDAQGNKTFQYQQASARLYGAEAAADLHPKIWKGFQWNNTFAVVYGINTQNSLRGKGIAGEYLPLIPPLQWLSHISQEIRTGSATFTTLRPGAGLEYNGAQNRYMGLYNTETYTGSYTLVDLSLSLTVRYAKNHSLEFLAQVNNLFDEAYQSHLSRLKYFEYYTHSPNGHLGIYGMGRNSCIKMILGF